MITIQHLLDLGMLNDENYVYRFDDEYNDVMNYAQYYESKDLYRHLNIVKCETRDRDFRLTITPDAYLVGKYRDESNKELIDAVQAVRVKCNSISCKECPYYTNTKPGGSPFENCKLTKSAPYLW